jgi:DNA-binding transcriptional ArsR family regulator
MDRFAKKAQLLAVMANAHRLRVLTTLSEGERAVGDLAGHIGLSQSALSQHLSKLKTMDLVRTRRDAQSVFYSVKSDQVGVVLAMLDDLFGEEPVQTRRKAS